MFARHFFQNSLESSSTGLTRIFLLLVLFTAGLILVLPQKTFAAAPAVSSIVFRDNNNDGQVDQIRITFDQTIATCNALVAGDWTLTANSLTGAAIAGGSLACTGTDAIVNITLGTAGPANATGAATVPTLAYTRTTSQIRNAGAEEAANFTATNVTDATAPTLKTITRTTNASSQNIFTLVYTESMTPLTGASSTVGNLVSGAAGTLAGFGTFATVSEVFSQAAKNTLATSTTTFTNDTVTITMAGEAGAYLELTGTSTLPAGVFTPAASGSVIASAGTPNQVNTSRTQTVTAGTAWDVTRPTITAAVLRDDFVNNGNLIAGGTFNAGSDGKVDTLRITLSEAVSADVDASNNRADWAISTTVQTEYGTTLTVIKTARNSTTNTIFEVNFSGANSYYELGKFAIQWTADATVNFKDAAGNLVNTTSAKLCGTGQACTGGAVNSAIITEVIPDPVPGDTTAPDAPGAPKAVVGQGDKIVLTWTAPTATDLHTGSGIKIYRHDSKNTTFLLVNDFVYKAGVTSYTDSNVTLGETYTYLLYSQDTSGNMSTASTEASVKAAKYVSPTGGVRFLVSSYNSGAVDVYLDDELLHDNLKFGQLSKITTTVTDAAHTIDIRDDEAKAEDDPLLTSQVTLTASGLHTMVFDGDVSQPGAFGLLNYAEDLTNTSETKAKVRFVHLAGDASKVDLFHTASETELFKDISLGTTTTFAELDPAESTLVLRAAGTSEEALFTSSAFKFEAKNNYTAYAVGLGAPAEGQSMLKVVFAGPVDMEMPEDSGDEDDEEPTGEEGEEEGGEEDTGDEDEEDEEDTGDDDEEEDGEEELPEAYSDQVKLLISKKIIEKADTLQQLANRAEAAMIIVRVAGIKYDKAATTCSAFNDVPSWAAGAVCRLHELKIVKGKSEGVYGSSDDVTRYEFSTMLWRALQIEDGDVSQPAGLLDAAEIAKVSWAKEAVFGLFNLGIIKGFEEAGGRVAGGERTILKQDLGVLLLRSQSMLLKLYQ